MVERYDQIRYMWFLVVVVLYVSVQQYSTLGKVIIPEVHVDQCHTVDIVHHSIIPWSCPGDKTKTTRDTFLRDMEVQRQLLFHISFTCAER